MKVFLRVMLLVLVVCGAAALVGCNEGQPQYRRSVSAAGN